MKKAKGTVFIEHIKKHLEELHIHAEVICKICDLSVDEIYEEWKKNGENQQ